MIDTVADVCNRLPLVQYPELAAPIYCQPYQDKGCRIAMAVESMKRHTTDEGWQIMAGLQANGYTLAGYNLSLPETDSLKILGYCPTTLVVQDKREWDVKPKDFREKRAKFTNIESLASQPTIFKMTILKDSHNNQPYHAESAREIGCNGWIIYYHPTIVKQMAPYIRLQHCIRTYHTLDAEAVPTFNRDRRGALLSGACSGAYPLRRTLINHVNSLPSVDYLQHPGYHMGGCCTPSFLHRLNKYKVAICTCSILGYSLRKIMEATACGCRVITNLPSDEILPQIDDNLIRVPSDISPANLSTILQESYSTYDEDKQRHYAQLAKSYYDYRVMGKRLAHDIEHLRCTYTASV